MQEGTRKRAVWMDIHRDIAGEADVADFVAWCGRHNIGLAFPCVNHVTGFMTYPSDLAPRARATDTWDPTAAVVRACRAAGIEVHAWVCIANWGPPRIDRSLLSAAGPRPLQEGRPEWFCVNHDGRSMLGMSVPYAFLNLARPEVRAFHGQLCEEILGRYAFDGYHLDYIRFHFAAPQQTAQPRESYRGPAEAVVPLEGTERMSFDDATLRAFEYETGMALSGMDCSLAAQVRWLYGGGAGASRREAWYAWKASKVTALVRDLRVVTARLQRRLSAAVFGGYPWCGQEVAQRWPQWVDGRLLDLAAPMDYGIGLGDYPAHLAAQNAVLQVEPKPATPMLSGLGGFATFVDLSPAAAAAQLAAFEDAAESAGRRGVCLYDYRFFRRLLA